MSSKFWPPVCLLVVATLVLMGYRCYHATSQLATVERAFSEYRAAQTRQLATALKNVALAYETKIKEYQNALDKTHRDKIKALRAMEGAMRNNADYRDWATDRLPDGVLERLQQLPEARRASGTVPN